METHPISPDKAEASNFAESSNIVFRESTTSLTELVDSADANALMPLDVSNLFLDKSTHCNCGPIPRYKSPSNCSSHIPQPSNFNVLIFPFSLQIALAKTRIEGPISVLSLIINSIDDDWDASKNDNNS